jgi:protein-L-isoaspartate(D-aspartate) O-methyltransferase
MRFPFHDDNLPDGEAAARHAMVAEQLRARGIRDERVLAAMGQVPRHAFVPPELRDRAYWDGPLPIGDDQTISQPYIVAAMSEALGAPDGGRVLEIGTGSGYQAAVLAEMGLEVYTVEFLARLAAEARARLEWLGYRDIHYRIGDGRAGWPHRAPFDGILVTAAPADLPPALAGQLGPAGRLVIPVGRWDQELRVYQRQDDGHLSMQRLFGVRFVPLVGD